MTTIGILGQRLARLTAVLMLTATPCLIGAATIAVAEPGPGVDAHGCWYDATAPAWQSARGDGLCHAGPHAVEVTGELA